MKAFIFTLATFFSITAMADQCQLISSAEADRALSLLKPGMVVSRFCEACGDTEPTSTEVIYSVSGYKVNGVAELSVNGKTVDLAYLYLQVAPGKKINVALAIGCETLDPTTVSSVIK